MFKLCSYTFLSVLAVDILATSGDITLTWTSPILPKLYSTDPDINPLDRPITPDEESWIGSLINIGALIGPLPIGYISEKFGRKWSLLCVSLPYIVSFVVLAFVHNVYMYYFARLLAGISVGAACSILPLYIAEIAEDSNRGMLSVTLNIFWTFGNLIPYVIGPYMPVMWFNITLACFPIIFFFVFLIVGPESPYYLVAKDEISKAEESLMKLRSRSRSGVGKEVLKIQMVLQEDNKSSDFLEIFKTKANLKALYISLCLIAFQQLSGINAIVFYTELIFHVSGSSLSDELSAIIIGLVLFSSSLIIPFVADRFGRRLFLIISSIGMMISLAVLGTDFYLKDSTPVEVSSFSFLPILSMVCFIISFNLGFGVLPWTVSSELFPVNVKPTGASLVSLTCWFFSFLVTKFFNDLNNLFGNAGTFWLFSGFCLVALIFTCFCVPETRGKSFKEIQEILEK